METKNILLQERYKPNEPTVKEYVVVENYPQGKFSAPTTEMINKHNCDLIISAADLQALKSAVQNQTGSEHFNDSVFMTKRIEASSLKQYDPQVFAHFFDIEKPQVRINIVIQHMSYDFNLGEVEFMIGAYTFNSLLRTLKYKGEHPLHLSTKETKILKLLSCNKGDVVPRDFILDKIWNNNDFYTSRSLDVYISKLRKLLKKDDAVTIFVVRGVGFRLFIEK